MARDATLQPRTRVYEWGGPVGAACMVLMLPCLVLALHSLCDADACRLSDVVRLPQRMARATLTALPFVPYALVLELAWLAAHCAFYLCPVGRVVAGQPLRTGEVLRYRMNAIHAFALSHCALAALHVCGVFDLTWLADHVVALLLASVVVSTCMSVALYAASHRSARVLTALGGNTGNAVYDFWVGRELNPRSGFVDWKFVCELRPGLIGWSVLNWAFVVAAARRGTLSPSLVAVALFESMYVVDGLLLEAGNLTMMDIVTDGFGYMLCFGDLTWVPFVYTLQAKYLAYHAVHLPLWHLLLCVALVLGGFALFRGANSQKNRFRTNPHDPRVRHLRVLRTSSSKSLLISGYWGICRHPNYVGDWLMSVGWAALCGTAAALPYFHPVYFGALLVHRQLRDEEQMRARYGDKDWRAFCRIVRYRLIPYIY